MATRKPTVDVLKALLEEPAVSRETQPGLALHYVELSRMSDNPFQTRMANDPDHVLGIAASLVNMTASLPDTRGLQQVPIGRLIRWGDGTKVPAGVYDNPAELRAVLADKGVVVELAFGHSRRLAFNALAYGVKSVFPDLGDNVQLSGVEFDPATYADMPVILMPIDDTAMWVHAVTENGQRRDITAIEEAHAIRRATTELGMTLEQAGKTLNKSRSAASNLMRLLELPQEYQDAVLSGQLTERHGRAILALAKAPHLMQQLPSIAEMSDLTVVQLEKQTKIITSNCRTLSPAKGTGYTKSYQNWDGFQSRTEKFDPVPWPPTWTPATPDAAIIGPCDGCEYRVQFGGDAGPRCTQPEPKGTNACYVAKERSYNQEQIARQREAAAKMMEQKNAEEATAAATPAPAGTVPVTAPPKMAAQMPREDEIKDVYWFESKRSWSNAPAELIDKGLCSAERCQCFVLAYNRNPSDNNVRPDAEHTPNMCYGCTSQKRLANRKLEMEHGDVGQMRKAIKEENAACKDFLDKALVTLGASELWSNTEFMRDLVAAGTNYPQHYSIAPKSDAKEIQRCLWLHVAESHCSVWGTMGVDGSTRRWGMVRTMAWLRSLLPGLTAKGRDDWARIGIAAVDPTTPDPDPEPDPQPQEQLQRDEPPADVADQPTGKLLVEYTDEDWKRVGVATEAKLDDVLAALGTVATETAATDELADGWQWQKKGAQLRACIVVDGEEIKTRWHATAAEVIADAKYMNRELQLA